MLNYFGWNVFLAHDDIQFVHCFAFDMKSDSPLVCQMLPSWLLMMMMMNSRQELKYQWLLLTNSPRKELYNRELKAKVGSGDL